MPCFSILLKGDELVGDQLLKIRRPLKCKYIKLLHAYTNLNSTNFNGSHPSGTKNAERLLFAKFSFINADQYDNFNSGHSYVSLGASSHGVADNKMIVRDLYKVLLDEPVIELKGDMRVRLYFLTPECKIVPLTSDDINATSTSKNLEVNFMNIIIEYEEMK